MRTQLIIRRLLGVTLAVTLGAVIAIYEPHRHLLATVWPLVEAFWAYQTR